jgi:hypothetical protein
VWLVRQTIALPPGHRRAAGGGGMSKRINAPIAAVHESAFGTKRTSQLLRGMSAFWGKADIVRAFGNVRY